ncbi:MAG: argininosuccinate lyase [Bacillota bacterium]|nr:MAG: argininosuccinate lyase [Bacillota bacterium]
MSIRKEIEARDGTAFPGRTYAETVLAPVYETARQHLLEPLVEVHRAHLVMLAETGLIPREQGQAIARALRALDLEALARSRYDGRYEDLFFCVEDHLLRTAGEVAGNLHIGRSRNDMGVTLYRLVLRERLLGALEAAVGLHAALLEVAEQHAETVMLAYTHTQPAQPTTLGHWLLAAADVLARDIRRLIRAYEEANRSPMGAAALGTTGFAIDRERVAELLGFDGVVENAYDAVAAADYLGSAAAAVELAAIDMGRVVQDFLLWATQEFGAIRVADAYVQCSSIMPQKRNPVSLEHCRALLSSAAGSAAAVLQMLHNTPFGDIVDTEDDLQPHLWRALEAFGNALRLLTAVVATLEVRADRLLERARASYASVTELADSLVREHGIPFRQAHRVVSAAVREALARGIEDVRRVPSALWEEAAARVLGRPLRLDPERVRQALDPEHFVAVRRVRGGVAPAEVRRMLADRQGRHQDLVRWLREARDRLERARAKLDAAFAALAGGQGYGAEGGAAAQGREAP